MAERIQYGRSVVDDRLQYLSPSSMTTADPESEGCLRKWWYGAKMGIKAPQTRAQTRGVSLHEEVERFMATGDRSLSSLALAGLHMVPDPGPGLGLEVAIAPSPDLSLAPVRAAGVPIVGYIDCVHARGTNKGANNVEDALDPPGTIEVIDWKTTSDPKWIKSAREMGRTIQMTTYGHWVIAVEPRVQHVRLSHGYFVERGGPSRKVSLRVLPEQIERNWERVEAVARTVVDAAPEHDPDRVPANIRACDKFGGCPAREVCKARMHQALSSFIGQAAAEKLLGGAQETEMGLVDSLNKDRADRGLPVTTKPAETAAAIDFEALLGSAPAPDLEAQKAAERAKLEAEEAAKREAAMLRQAADKFGPIVAELEGLAAANAATEMGVPTFTGEAARAYCAVKRAEPRETVPGAGKLAGKVIATVAEAAETLAKLAALAAAGQIKPAAAPAMTGAPAGIADLLSPEAPAPTPPAAPAASTNPPVAPGAAAPAGSHDPAGASAGTVAEKPKAEPKPKKPKEQKPAGTQVHVFVDQHQVEGAELTSLHPIIDALAAEVAALSKDMDLRAAGVRDSANGLFFAKDESPGSFGRWEGLLHALIVEKGIPPGSYHLSTRGNRIAEVAASALRSVCAKTGGLFAWGGR